MLPEWAPYNVDMKSGDVWECPHELAEVWFYIHNAVGAGEGYYTDKQYSKNWCIVAKISLNPYDGWYPAQGLTIGYDATGVSQHMVVAAPASHGTLLKQGETVYFEAAAAPFGCLRVLRLK